MLPESTACDSKKTDEGINNLDEKIDEYSKKTKPTKDADDTAISNRNISAESSQTNPQKSSKRYSDRRRDDKMRKDLTNKTNRPPLEDKHETRQNATLDEMAKDLSNILHLGTKDTKQIPFSDKNDDGNKKDERKQTKERSKDQEETDAHDTLEIEKRKNKVYNTSMYLGEIMAGLHYGGIQINC